MQDGSLDFYLKADVREPGRYVVTGRVDDANGRPFALLSFNEEVAGRRAGVPAHAVRQAGARRASRCSR